jgi:hypothetical protein
MGEPAQSAGFLPTKVLDFIDSASRLSVLGLFVVCFAERGIPQMLCGLGN